MRGNVNIAKRFGIEKMTMEIDAQFLMIACDGKYHHLPQLFQTEMAGFVLAAKYYTSQKIIHNSVKT